MHGGARCRRHPYGWRVPRDVTPDVTQDVTLQQAADELGVHYMTAYRYVRLGHLDADKVAGVWRVAPSALEAFRSSRRSTSTRATASRSASRSAPRSAPRSAQWSDRLRSRLVAGDAAGAWGVIESALSGGMDVRDVYLDLITPAMRAIGDQWECGEIDVSVEHRASGIASRLVGRLGPRCVRRGRSRGTVVLGCVAGERHGLGVAVLADLLRIEGWAVSDLGADTPHASFVTAASSIDDVVAIGISVTHGEYVDACAEACGVIRSSGITLPVIVGGQAIGALTPPPDLGADGYAVTADDVISFLQSLDE
jgi:methanogenic corrinoid protein MtbC1